MQLAGRPGGGCPAIVGLVGEQVPGEDGELAGHGDRGDPGPPAGKNPGMEGVERARRPDRDVGGLREQAPDVALTGLADVADQAGRPPDWRTRGSSPR